MPQEIGSADLRIYAPQGLSGESLAQRQLALESARALMQERQQKALEQQQKMQDDAFAQRVFSDPSNLGENGHPDPEKILAAVHTNPRVYADVENFYAGIRSKVATAAHAEAEANKLRTDSLAQVAGATNDENYPMNVPTLIALDPSLKDRLGPQLTPEIKMLLTTLKENAVSVGERLTREKELRGKAGDLETSAQYVFGSLDPSSPDYAAQLADKTNEFRVRNYGVPGVNEFLKSLGAGPDVPTKANAQARTAQEKVASAETERAHKEAEQTRQETGARADAAAAATEANRSAIDAREQQRLSMERQRLSMEGQRLTLEKQKATTTGGAAIDPATLAGYVKNLQNGKWNLSNVPLKDRDAVVGALQSSGVDVAKLTAADFQMKNQAISMLPMIDKVQQLAAKIDKMGLMGTVGGRWRSLVTGESSASSLAGLTPEQKQLVGEFASTGGLLITGIARAHGGARAGGSPQMIAHLTTLLDATHRDLPTFIGVLNGERNFMNEYAHMGETPNSAAKQTKTLANGHVIEKQDDGSWLVIK